MHKFSDLVHACRISFLLYAVFQGKKFKPNQESNINNADDLEFANSAFMKNLEPGMFSDLVDDLVEEYLNESDCMGSEYDDNSEFDDDSQNDDDSVSDDDSESDNDLQSDNGSESDDDSVYKDMQDGEECAFETSR